jgi:hypothetical protein
MNQQPLVHHPFETCYDSIMDDSHLGYRVFLFTIKNHFFTSMLIRQHMISSSTLDHNKRTNLHK